MESLGILIVIAVAIWIYKSAYSSGKREGSRKGYGVGYDRGSRGRGKSGCMIFLVATAAALTASAVAVACWF